MKKIFFLLAFSVGQLAYSQTFFDVGIKASWDADYLLNKNLLDENNFRYLFSWGYGFGGKLGINFGESHGLCFEGGMSKITQDYKYGEVSEVKGEFPYRRSLEFQTIDFLMLYRRFGKGQYIEIGPQYSLYKKPSFTDSEGVSFGNDISALQNKSNVAAVFGFGGNILKGSEVLFVTFGFRFKYHFMDLISDQGQAANYFTGQRNYPDYKKTNVITGSAILGIEYAFGYFAYAQCRGRRVFVAF